ncbi:hypothetical protein L6R53_29650, partial [Myxococcota bacterium]|nr:hypothetical protein [Myxococcota bacterium]
YAALELQRVGYRWEQGDRVLSIFHQDSRQVQAIAWQRTREGLQRFAALAAREGFQPGVVLFQHGPLEGIPALAIEGILAESGIPALDLDPLWGGYARFVREHSFRFDLHPRPAAHALAAQTLAAWMNHQGWLGAAPDPTATRWAATWPARVEQWRAGQRALAQEQRRQLRELEERYGAVLPAPGAPADQWLYGCWQQPQPGGPPAWLLSTRGGFKLRAADAGARALRVEGSRRDRPSDPPLSLAATCEGHSLGAPVTPTDARFTAQWSLPAPAPAGGLVECELVASGTVPGPRDPGGKPGIPSSFQLHRLELVP